MLDGMSDSIQGSRIENLHSREVDRQSRTGLIFHCCCCCCCCCTYSGTMHTKRLDSLLFLVVDSNVVAVDRFLSKRLSNVDDGRKTIITQTLSDRVRSIRVGSGRVTGQRIRRGSISGSSSSSSSSSSRNSRDT